MTTLEKKRMLLLNLAREQGGYFTARQAEEIGFDNANQHRFIKDGRWIRVRRGIFRLASEPEEELSDLQALSLFFRYRDGSPCGVFGLETAAVVHKLGDYMPGVVSLLVRPGFRKSANIPDGVELIQTQDITTEVVREHGVYVTSPLRTLVDLLQAKDRDPEETRRAFIAARRSGLIAKSMLKDLPLWAPMAVVDTLMNWELRQIEGGDP